MVQESVQKWTISLCLEHADLFPSIAEWEAAISPGALWQVTLPNSTEWMDAIVEGDRRDGQRGRLNITIAAMGLDAGF
jgi:hypothetical protein